MSWPNNVGVWGPPQSIWLEPFPTCSPRMQSCDLQIPGSTRIVGKPWYRCMVHWPIHGPLLMQSFFCPRDKSISNIWFCRIISTTLPAPFSHVEWTPAGSDRWTCHNNTWDATGTIKQGCHSCETKIGLTPVRRTQSYTHQPIAPLDSSPLETFNGHHMFSRQNKGWNKGWWTPTARMPPHLNHLWGLPMLLL